MHTKITFEFSINPSLQVGDAIYFSQTNAGPVAGDPVFAGLVYNIFPDNNYIVIDKDPSVPPIINPTDFILFAKDVSVNESSLKGYYADISFENASNTKTELFAFGSEIALSSK